MKEIKVLTAIAGFILTASFCALAQDPFTNGLVAYYPFNGNADDASGNANHATPAGNYQFLTNGLSGGAIRIIGDGSVSYSGGGHVMLPTFGSNMNSGFSLSLWVKDEVIGVEPVGAEAYITFQPQDVYPHCQIFLLNWSPSPRPSVAFEIHSGPSAAVFEQSIDMGTYPNAWKHLALVSGPGKFACYFNGSKIYETNVFYTNIFPAPYNALGRHWWPTGSSARMSVTYDNVRIYNRALLDSEVQQLYAYDGPFCSPHRATATATLVNGFVVGATITDGGCGYTNAPLVLIQGGGGSNATATAVISNGVVVGINITSAGCCYTSVPRIEIASPSFVPTLSIRVSKVKVAQNVVLGRNYVLESSTDLTNWTAVGPPFTATSESVADEFDVDVTGRFFRIRQVP